MTSQRLRRKYGYLRNKIRENWRASEDAAEVKPKSAPARKNTRDYCRGNKRHPHQPVVVMNRTGMWSGTKRACGTSAFIGCFHSLECKRCHKILVHFLNMEHCPDLWGPEGPEAAVQAWKAEHP